MDHIKTILAFIGKRKKNIALGYVFVIIANLFKVIIPKIVGKAVDILQDNFSMETLLKICGLILFLELMKGISQFLMRYIIIGTSWRVENDIRLRIYGHLLKLPLSFYNKSRTGDIIARITNDLIAVRALMGPGIMYSAIAAFILPVALIFMLSIDVELALYGILPFPFIAVTIYFAGKKIHVYFRSVQESYSDISAHVQENLNGIRLVKAFVREKSEYNTLNKLNRKYVDNNKRVINLQAFYHPMLDVLASTGVIIILWIGGKKVASGETTLGTLVSIIMYIGILVWPSIAIGWVVAVFQRGTASLKRINEILDEETERQDESDDIRSLDGSISVKNLRFSYNGESDVINDISFDLKSGKTLAVVGRTGSGKTTLLGLLSGVYDVAKGAVFYDNIDINELSLSRLRASISLVPQETFLFSESVAENISFGKEDADEASIKRAAVLAAIADEIDTYPDGYDTLLGERGVTVSGGQRQRLAIARALISDAPILFFDDCLSNVDTVTEMKILKNLKSVIKGRTAVIVTHRLGSVTDADEIIYMKQGRIIERGTHDELMAVDGEYAALYSEQESLDHIDDDMIQDE